MERARNPDGTYNGAKLMSALTGGTISEAETLWTFNRLRTLMQQEGRSKEEAKEIVRQEASDRPWEVPA